MNIESRITRLATKAFASSVLLLSAASHAHPGHEPEDLIHAVAHELMSPRGIALLLIVAAVGAIWWVKRSK